jgi:hypothetical protein
VSEIYAELEAAREHHRRTGSTSAEDRWARRKVHLYRWLPRFVRIAIMRRFMSNAFTIKRIAGTTLVTSVGKFAAIPGFAFTFATGPRAATFAIGSVVEKPWIHDGQITARSILGLSIMVNHDLVDGAPATRFARRLQELVESAAGLGRSDPKAQEVHESNADAGRAPCQSTGGRGWHGACPSARFWHCGRPHPGLQLLSRPTG